MAMITTHQGIVTSVREGCVSVQIHVVSACATCEAHSHCGFADSKDKIMDIDTPQWEQYHEGDRVTVAVNSNRGLQAVFIAYIVPTLLFLTTFLVTLCVLHLSDGWVALITLAVIALYALVLYLRRQHLQQRFTMTLTPNRPLAD